MSNLNAVLARNIESAPVCQAFSQTVAFSHYNNLSAQLPFEPKTGKIVEGCIKAQAKQCFDNIKAVVESIDHRMSDIVRVSIFVTDIQDIQKVDEVYASYFTTYKPTRTAVVVNELPFGAKIQIDALMSNGEGTIPNAPQAGDLIKLKNNTPNAPITSLSSQSVAFSHYNNLTTQLPIDPKTGRLVVGGIKEQSFQCFKNVKAILESIDVPMDDIVKVTLFLKDLNDIDTVNEVYTTVFPDSAIARCVGYMPARTVLEAKELELGALIQAEVVVSHGDGTPPQLIEDRHGIVIEANNTKNAPIDPYSTQTVAFSHYNHISAQLPLTSDGKFVGGDIKAQTKQCLENIKNIIESIDHSLEDIVKVNMYLTDMSQMMEAEKVYAEFFPKGTPAKRVVGVANNPHNALIQIEAIAGNAEGTPPVK
ncbi:MAG: hypothetical protein KGV58_00260 [Campylobacteraceae bacterium]|nr:hypothetical protein [Campylobacteraceae bacterium]